MLSDDGHALFNVLCDIGGRAPYSTDVLNAMAERLTDEGWHGAPGSNVPSKPTTPKPAPGYSLTP